MEYQTGGSPQSGSLFIQIDNEQLELTGSAFKSELIPCTREPITESIRQAVLQAVKERAYG